MKKFIKFSIICIILCLIITVIAFINKTRYDAKVIYNSAGEKRIEYLNEVYCWWGDICYTFEDEGVTYGYEMYPYYFTEYERHDLSSKIYLPRGHNSIFTDLFFSTYYFCFFDKNDDYYSNFIILCPEDTSISQLYLKENFVFPTIGKNKVESIWTSIDVSDSDNIKDKETVDKIVECAKSNGEIELDKDVYDYIRTYSADHHCLWLKYEGYPLVEEFYIEETEDGRYIIDQYTPEEYDTIYWEEEAHQ